MPTRFGVEGQPLAEQVRDLTAALQGPAGSPYSKTFTRLLRELELRTDTVGSTVTATGSSGYLRGRLSADGRLDIGIDTYGLMSVVGATCTKVMLRLPDGFVAGNRAALSGHNETRQAMVPAKIITAGTEEVGFLSLEGAYVCAYRAAGAAFVVGNLGIYGQLWADVFQAGEL